MATDQQRKFGGVPINKRKPTLCELETGKTEEELRQIQRDLKAAAIKRFLGEKA